ncbi:cytochrome c peroxidase [Pedobacter deserti]|uniref:cytochrome c peroxidase n=1 Tax=Pedobacter deserti TaxID=2817382 RepID=UPI002109A749|nr:cytochrome c peroxidase [Pedobacter sp. SYSU D00382]
MINRFFNAGLACVVLLFGLQACERAQQDPAESVKAIFEQELKRLRELVDGDLLPAAEGGDSQKMKLSLARAREQYKRIEYYFEYFFPKTAVLVNGPPIDEIELGENLVEPPTGFQVMEELIFDEQTAESRAELINEIKKMQVDLKRAVRYNAEYQITDAQLFDAMRLEVFRIISLGITGFDSPAALTSLPEASAALSGIMQAIELYPGHGPLKTNLEAAIAELGKAEDFNTFDRLAFTAVHLQEVSESLAKLRKQLNIETAASGSALQDSAVTMFQKQAFDVNRFTSNHTEFISDAKVSLGKTLFNSALLSKKNDRSCASCHRESMAFTDGLKTAEGINGRQSLLRNTPSLLYAGMQRAFFYDLKAASLEDQALDVVHHKNEMDGSLDDAAREINRTGVYLRSFKAAYGETAQKASPWKIQHAIASYIRSLAPFSSRTDQYLRGDRSKLSAAEKRGYNLFMGKAKCGSCHFAPLYNGTPAPLFHKSEGEVLGVPSRADTVRALVDQDGGRYALNPYPQYRFAFKTPTLRNVARTAPYMHNGVYQTLEEVLDFYNRGGGAGIGIALDNQSLSADPLNLSKQEIKDIVEFLKALNDEKD